MISTLDLEKICGKIDFSKRDFLDQNLTRASNRSKAWEIEVNCNDLYLVGELQNWQCAITGQLLEFTRGGGYWQNKWCNPNSCTIDRINPKLGYIRNNVQLLTWRANQWKSSFTDKELKDLCEQYLKNIGHTDQKTLTERRQFLVNF